MSYLKNVLNLERNPFSPDGRAKKNQTLFWEDKDKKSLWDIIVNSFDMEAEKLFIILGDLGMGKTQSLYHVSNCCELHSSKSDNKLFPVYIDVSDIEGGISTLTRAIIPVIIKDESFVNIVKKFTNYKTSIIKPIESYNSISNPSNTLPLDIVYHEYLDLLGEIVDKRDFAKFLKITETPRNAWNFLDNLLKILKHENGTLLLLIDQLEDFLTYDLVTIDEKRDTLRYIRKLLADHYTTTCIIMGCTLEGWESVSEIYPALEQRYPIGMIKLEKLNLVQTADFIMYFLKANRNDSSLKTFYPFNENLIKEIHLITEGNPRKIMVLCYNLIKELKFNNIEKNIETYLKSNIEKISQDALPFGRGQVKIDDPIKAEKRIEDSGLQIESFSESVSTEKLKNLFRILSKSSLLGFLTVSQENEYEIIINANTNLNNYPKLILFDETFDDDRYLDFSGRIFVLNSTKNEDYNERVAYMKIDEKFWNTLDQKSSCVVKSDSDEDEHAIAYILLTEIFK